MIDLHIHTDRCGHACGALAEYVAHARRSGLSVIAFTDHLPLPESVLGSDPHAKGYAMPLSELGAYVCDVLAMKDESSTPRVLLGIEADHIPGHETHVEELLGSHEFDVVLGSVHYLDGWAFDDPGRVDGYAGKDLDDLWARYFDLLIDAAESGLYDVIGHPDLMKKFGFLPPGGLDRHYVRAARRFAEAGVAIEVNTAGLRKPCAEVYPAPAFLHALHDAGVPVTVGSDAHCPGDVGAGWTEAARLLRSVGYREVLVFDRRQPRGVAL